MGIEPLKSRLFPAGEFSVTVEAGDLVISGDAADKRTARERAGRLWQIALRHLCLA